MYRNIGKRLFDVALSGAGLILLSPLLAGCAVLLKLTSRGPVFFSQERVGRNGTRFRILKFRTMRAAAPSRGLQITVAGDARIMPAGRFLRKTKIDELPQLWCVLKGDMSLVGPRPEVPEYVADYTPEQRKVLTVRPGITDPSSILYSNEEEVLAASDDPGSAYRHVVLPRKLALSSRYVRQMSLVGDIEIIMCTLGLAIAPEYFRRRVAGRFCELPSVGGHDFETAASPLPSNSIGASFNDHH